MAKRTNDLHHQTIPKSIWALGFSTFLMNVSSVIVFGLAAVYMKTILNINTGWIGFIEGAVEACSYATKLMSGVFSDFLQKRKIIMIFGFALATLARPLLAIFSSFGFVCLARFFDRVGNGLQSTPRDALVADLSPPNLKGKCYGMRQSLAMAGSFMGGILCFCLMSITSGDFQKIFLLASIPAFLGLLILIFMVYEPKEYLLNSSFNQEKIKLSDIQKLGQTYWILMLITAVFMLARVGEAMLILHACENFKLSITYTPFILILYNAASSFSSYPIGHLSDQVPRYYLLGFGFLALIVADLMLVFASNMWMLLLGVIMWGVQIGVTQSMFMALIADSVPARLRGTGFGFFYLISAVSLVLSATFGGIIAQYYSEFATFLFSLFVAVIALFILVAFRKEFKTKAI